MANAKKLFFLCLTLPLIMNLFLYGDTINLSKSNADSVWPAIATNSQGEVMVVWTEGDIYYRVFKSGQWENVNKSGIVQQIAWSNQLDVDSLGTFHVTYADGYGSHTRDIYYSYYTGNSWVQGECLYVSPYNSAWNKMDIDSNDDIHVIWYHSLVPKGSPVSSDIVTMAKGRMGNWPGSYENISNSTRVESIHPAIAVREGNVYSCWMEDERPRSLYFCEKIGGVWNAPIEISEIGYYPDMDIDNNGNIHIVFSRRGENFYYISRVNGVWGLELDISSGNAPLQFGDIKSKDHVLAAVWTQGTDGDWSVYASGKIMGCDWQIPVKVGDAHGGLDGNKHVQVAIDNQYFAHIVWEAPGVNGNTDIFYKKISLFNLKDDLLGTWQNQGVFYRDSDTRSWIEMAAPAELVACGDLDGDWVDDLIGLWPDQGGVWVKLSSTGEWIDIPVIAADLDSGDMNGDGRDDILGTIDEEGVFYLDSISYEVIKMAPAAESIAAGDLDGDGTDDLIGVWIDQGGVWVRYSSTERWSLLTSPAEAIASGDMNGDGRDDLLGSWNGQGVFYKDSISGRWVQMSSTAELIAAGDLDGDGTDDLIGIWSNQGGIWVKYSSTGDWAFLATEAEDLTAGNMNGETCSADMRKLIRLKESREMYTEGPASVQDFNDTSWDGPGGWNFEYQEAKNLIPFEERFKVRSPGPGEPGFHFIKQKNLIPQYNVKKK